MNQPEDGDSPSTGAKYTLDFRFEGGCLTAEAGGRVATLEEAIAFFRDIAAELRKTGAKSLLIIDGSDGIVPDAHEFEILATSLAGAGFEGVRTAFVDADTNAIERIEVGEIIARGLGYQFRVFNSEALANLWLRYGRDE